MNFRIYRICLILLLNVMMSCTWHSHVRSYNFEAHYQSNPKDYTLLTNDTIFPIKIDSMVLIDGDTLYGLFENPTSYYTRVWYDSKNRKYRSGLFYKEHIILHDTTFYKNAVIRTVNKGQLCFACKNWSYTTQSTIYYDRKGRPLVKTIRETNGSYKQYFNKKGDLLARRYQWPIISVLNE